MADYLVMNEQQKQMANAVCSTVTKAVVGMHPMAVFEGLCTLVAYSLHVLDLPLESAQTRIRDRLAVMQKVVGVEGNVIR